MDKTKGRPNKCVRYYFRGENSSILFEFSAKVANKIITSGFQIENKLFNIMHDKCGKIIMNRYDGTYIQTED